jgi:cell division protein FtsL
MSIDVEYAIKKDIRNNPVVREIDAAQRREFLRTLTDFALIVGMLLFAAYQHSTITLNNYRVAQLEKDRAKEEAFNRQLHLELEVYRAPQAIETRALEELHMVWPTSKNTLIIERAPSAVPAKTIVASVR